MRAAIYEQFGGGIKITSVPDPEVPEDGVIIEVQATGICRSDWYGWQGHDTAIALPHVPGHELAGIVLETGAKVHQWKAGDRVTTPFVCGCGHCQYCGVGQPQVCPHQTQPGFTHWGSFAEYVVVRNADFNLVRMPEQLTPIDGAVLGCRYGTAYRAVVQQARLRPDESIAIFGCGGLGQAAIQIASEIGARVIAVDIREENLQRAGALGATHTINSSGNRQLEKMIHDLTGGGCHVTLDAIGRKEVVNTAIRSLRRLGRHLQVGLIKGEDRQAGVHLDRILADELQIIGSHGIAAASYAEMFDFIERHNIKLSSLRNRRCTLEEGVEILMQMGEQPPAGVCVIDGFK